jgi:uncharacterized FlgJ-related protein
MPRIVTNINGNNLDEVIYSEVINSNYPDTLARLIVAQAKHETGNYTSNVFKSNKNLFGYKRYAGSPFQSGDGNMSPEGNNYAQYSSYKNSIQELLAWLRRRQNEGKLIISQLTSPSIYANALKKSGYYGASESEYYNALKYYLSKLDVLKKKASENRGWIFAMMGGLMAYYYFKKR